MTTNDFDELSGRIEGIARSLLILAGTLHRQGLLDQQKLQSDLRHHAQSLQPTVANYPTVIRTLEEVASELLVDLQFLKTQEQLGSQ